MKRVKIELIKTSDEMETKISELVYEFKVNKEDTISKSIAGIIDIRHYLNEEHYYSGHIGFVFKL